MKTFLLQFRPGRASFAEARLVFEGANPEVRTQTEALKAEQKQEVKLPAASPEELQAKVKDEADARMKEANAARTIQDNQMNTLMHDQSALMTEVKATADKNVSAPAKAEALKQGAVPAAQNKVGGKFIDGPVRNDPQGPRNAAPSRFINGPVMNGSPSPENQNRSRFIDGPVRNDPRNPETRNIVGAQGEAGDAGPVGPDGVLPGPETRQGFLENYTKKLSPEAEADIVKKAGEMINGQNPIDMTQRQRDILTANVQMTTGAIVTLSDDNKSFVITAPHSSLEMVLNKVAGAFAFATALFSKDTGKTLRETPDEYEANVRAIATPDTPENRTKIDGLLTDVKTAIVSLKEKVRLNPNDTGAQKDLKEQEGRQVILEKIIAERTAPAVAANAQAPTPELLAKVMPKINELNGDPKNYFMKINLADGNANLLLTRKDLPNFDAKFTAELGSIGVTVAGKDFKLPFSEENVRKLEGLMKTYYK